MRKLRWWIAGVGFLALLAILAAMRPPHDALDQLMPFAIAVDTAYVKPQDTGFISGPPGTVTPAAVRIRVFYVKGINESDLFRILRTRTAQMNDWKVWTAPKDGLSYSFFYRAMSSTPTISAMTAGVGGAIGNRQDEPKGTSYKIEERIPVSRWDLNMLRLRSFGRDPLSTSERLYPHPMGS